MEGSNRLARILQERILEVGERPPVMDFGIIQENMSLRLDNFPVSIPRRDYYTCSHTERGDRVLAAWVGDEVCVIGKLGRV